MPIDTECDLARPQSRARRASHHKQSYRINTPSRYWGPEVGLPQYRPGIDDIRRRWFAGHAPFQFERAAETAARKGDGNDQILWCK